MKSCPAKAAISSSSRCSGLSGKDPSVALGSRMYSGLWSRLIVLSPARPIEISLRPPEKPAIRCGSMNPNVIRRSAATKRSSTKACVPPDVSPTKVCSSISRARCECTGWRSTTSRPRISTSSSAVASRWSPVAMRISILPVAMPPASSARTTWGSTVLFGAGRVMSQTAIAALRLPLANCSSAGHPIGCAMASASAAFTSDSPAANRGRSTSVSKRSGNVTGAWPWSNARLTSMASVPSPGRCVIGASTPDLEASRPSAR